MKKIEQIYKILHTRCKELIIDENENICSTKNNKLAIVNNQVNLFIGDRRTVINLNDPKTFIDELKNGFFDYTGFILRVLFGNAEEYIKAFILSTSSSRNLWDTNLEKVDKNFRFLTRTIIATRDLRNFNNLIEVTEKYSVEGFFKQPRILKISYTPNHAGNITLDGNITINSRFSLTKQNIEKRTIDCVIKYLPENKYINNFEDVSNKETLEDLLDFIERRIL